MNNDNLYKLTDPEDVEKIFTCLASRGILINLNLFGEPYIIIDWKRFEQQSNSRNK